MATGAAAEPRINDRIRAREVRLIGSDGSQLGIMNLPDALQRAREQDLDLVEIAPLASPPVCKILDFGKYRYELAQRERESRKKSTNISIKEMKYRPKIGGGDFDTKTRHVREFLAEGHKVKVTIMFRGREVAHPELGRKILDRIAEDVGPLAKIEAMPKLDGRNMVMVLAPDKKAMVAATKAAKHGDDAADLAGNGAASLDGQELVEPDATAPSVPPVATVTVPTMTVPTPTVPTVTAPADLATSP